MSSTQTTSLIEFLLARFADDETVARAAMERNGAHWETVDLDHNGSRINGTADKGNPRAYSDSPELWDDEGALGMFAETATHIARHDPARVLAECEAKRRLLKGHENSIHRCDFGDHTWDEFNCSIKVALALPYADHADYMPEWKP